MGINRNSFTSESIQENTDINIQLLLSPPDTSEYLDVPVTPNIMVGFYNDVTDTVQLYVTDSTGRRYIKVQ